MVGFRNGEREKKWCAPFEFAIVVLIGGNAVFEKCNSNRNANNKNEVQKSSSQSKSRFRFLKNPSIIINKMLVRCWCVKMVLIDAQACGYYTQQQQPGVH